MSISSDFLSSRGNFAINHARLYIESRAELETDAAFSASISIMAFVSCATGAWSVF